MPVQAPEIVLESVLLDATSKVERKWKRSPEKWDIHFDTLLTMQQVLEERAIPLNELCQQVRAYMLELGFPVLANRLGRACRGESTAQTTPVYHAPPIVDVDYPSNYPVQTQIPAQAPPAAPDRAVSFRQRVESTVQLASDQLAADSGAPWLGVAGTLMGLAAVVRTVKRRKRSY